MATSSLSNDKRNFQCVAVASVDLIKLPLRDILYCHIKPADLFQKIKSCSTLNFRKEQKTICQVPPPARPDYNSFDVTLLYTLIRNLCSLPSPAQGWGNEPTALDTQLSDDIERLRLFRNSYYAHANSAEISDSSFKDIWRNLRSAISRIQSRYNADYEDELIRIEQSKYTLSHWEECMTLLKTIAIKQNSSDSRDEPHIIIKGKNEIICGGTARFEADVKNVESSCWSITWQKRRRDVIKCIDTNLGRYSGSTKKTLVINSVCKEDEGEYQAVFSRESNGPDYKSRNTIRLYAIGDVPSVELLEVSPIFCGSKATLKSKISSIPTPENIEWQTSRDGVHFHSTEIAKYSDNTDNSFVVHKATFADKLYYRLRVWNAIGETISNTVYLNVTGSPPNIKTISETNIINRSVKLIGNVIIYDDSPGVKNFFWTRNYKIIDFEECDGRLSETRTDNPSLTITNVGPDDAGEYRLTAMNDVGSCTSEAIVLGVPRVFEEKVEDENNGNQQITVTIKSIPEPYHLQWSAKRKEDDTFVPIDINAKEYEGTTVTLPHPVLFVKQENQPENIFFRIEVTNFIGNTQQDISDSVENTIYNDDGKTIKFTILIGTLVKQFPLEKLDHLKCLIKNSNKVRNLISVKEAASVLECIEILLEENLFTPTDVIYMQFLCQEADCFDLITKCVEYAECNQGALCYFKKPPANKNKNRSSLGLKWKAGDYENELKEIIAMKKKRIELEERKVKALERIASALETHQ